MRLFLLLVFYSTSLISYSQEYSVSRIHPDLLKGANAVVRLDRMHVKILGYDEMSVSSKRAVTVFNEEGSSFIHAYTFYDDNSKLKNLIATVYDANGTEIEKFKSKDFLDQSASGNGTLYSDDRVKYLRYIPSRYPYTVVFEQLYVTPDTAFLPRWQFLDGYKVSTQRSEFIFEQQSAIPFRFKEQNLEEFGIEIVKNENKWKYVGDNLAALKYESYGPDFHEITPSVKFALEQFQLKGVYGEAKNWNEFGQWVYDSLLKGRGQLDQNTINKIKDLVRNVKDPKEKVRKVYQFVQDNTRYVSVQLGIGGWMPISASEVDKVKYGDCKGLTNYTMALLKAIGIESYYTVVYADNPRRDIDPEFTAMQGNHAFLNVPLEGEELWLECTSQVVPVNHLGTFTDNRYVLKVTPNGGEIVKTKKTSAEQSRQLTNAEINLTTSGDVNARIVIKSTGVQYDQKYRLPLQNENDLERHYKDYWSYLNGLKVSSTSFKNDKKEIEITENINVSSSSYLSKAGDKILFAPNMFNRKLDVPKRYRDRKYDVVVKRGCLDKDEFIINIPDDYKIESLLEPVQLKTKFGDFKSSLEKLNDNQLVFKRELLVKSGVFEKQDYENLRNFYKKIARNDNAKIVLIKN